MKNTVYIISGPAGVGKSTTSRRLVETLARSSYISGDVISHLPVNGRGKPWLDKRTLDLTWKNILNITMNLLDYEYDVVIDYVSFPKEVKWLAEELNNRDVKIVYVVLLVDKETIILRDQLRPEEERMGERSLILLDEFENDSELLDTNKLYTHECKIEKLSEIIEGILQDDKYLLR
ncbi:AAA family ATPase [Paenibacillus gallinarum]|uniref:AAA family ATPase n=1 Tax=Paenibacillus gallinarum TaxID=2762232 RepID=A0ABR8T103_9BACL|nr:AAA family ATPase [Paenibacillus gallinarum]MBD7969274.1 AAA family ATPase [Paenibacillus gallinarum]